MTDKLTRQFKRLNSPNPDDQPKCFAEEPEKSVFLKPGRKGGDKSVPRSSKCIQSTRKGVNR
jgi:hypothetical protein